MKPLTEQDIRQKLKKCGDLKTLTIYKDTLVTPSAAEFVKMMQISLVYSDKEEAPKGKAPEAKTSQVFYGPDGTLLDHKGESMTHLHGNHLVYKDHPMIIWRGKLDSFTALLIEAQELGVEEGNQEFVDDLQGILDFVRTLLPTEYKNTPMEHVRILGLSSEELRERSHHPQKYYGFPHMLTDYRMGALSIRLNRLRTAARETELAAAAAFAQGSEEATREDIIEALNRLSSLFYILMYKYLPKGFTPASAGI
jgi:ethanolamine utilization cobalamin adenosyltransferase